MHTVTHNIRRHFEAKTPVFLIAFLCFSLLYAFGKILILLVECSVQTVVCHY